MVTTISLKRVNLASVDLGDVILLDQSDDPREIDFLQVLDDLTDGVLIGFTDATSAVVAFDAEVFVEVED